VETIDLSEKTVEEVRELLDQEEDVNYSRLLSREKSGKDRKTVKDILKRKIRKMENSSDERDFKGKLKQIAEEFRGGDDLKGIIGSINEGMKEDVDPDGRTLKPAAENESSKMDSPDRESFEPESRDEEFKERVENYRDLFDRIRDEMGQVVVGQEDIVEDLLIAMICDGHVLMEGVPGLGKSLTVETLSRTISGVDFNRIQFVSDMLPSDIMGQRVYNQKTGEFHINKGPAFTNLLLADEINRAPPKTLAALIEVMQEEKISIEKQEFDLEKPYLVLATQNPLEQKGTYTLPKTIIDRFFMKVLLDYPEPEEEEQIIKKNTIRQQNMLEEVEKVLNLEEIIEAQEDVREIYVSSEVRHYILKIVSVARGKVDEDMDSSEFIEYGPSPRASVWLAMGASAKAMMDGRTYAVPEDVKEVAKPVLRHRIILNYQGEISDTDTDDVVDEILESVEPL
jgi:MoxR-like ATPase